jgi:hypothetical protein
MPPSKDVIMRQEQDDEADPDLDDMEMEGIDLQGTVDACHHQEIKSIPLDHIKRFQQSLRKNAKGSTGQRLQQGFSLALEVKNNKSKFQRKTQRMTMQGKKF